MALIAKSWGRFFNASLETNTLQQKVWISGLTGMDERRWALHSTLLLSLVIINRVSANIQLMTPNYADDNYAHQMEPDEHIYVQYIQSVSCFCHSLM